MVPNGHIIYPQSEAALPRLHMLAARALTHDRDVVLDQEQGFLAALHQHRQSVGVLLSVQRHPVYAQHPVAGLQRALSAEENTTSAACSRKRSTIGKPLKSSA